MCNKIGDKLFFKVYRNIYLREQIYSHIRRRKESKMYNLIMSIDTWSPYIDLLNYSCNALSIENIKLIIISCVWIIACNLDIIYDMKTSNMDSLKICEKISGRELSEEEIKSIFTFCAINLRSSLGKFRFDSLINRLNIPYYESKSSYTLCLEVGKLLYEDNNFTYILSQRSKLREIKSNLISHSNEVSHEHLFDKVNIIGMLISFFSDFTDYIYHYMVDYIDNNENAKKIESHVLFFKNNYKKDINHNLLCENLLTLKPFNFHIINYCQIICSKIPEYSNMLDGHAINTFKHYIKLFNIPHGYICRKMCKIIINVIGYSSNIPKRMNLPTIQKYGKNYKSFSDMNYMKNTIFKSLKEGEYNARNREIEKLLIINKLISKGILQ